MSARVIHDNLAMFPFIFRSVENIISTLKPRMKLSHVTSEDNVDRELDSKLSYDDGERTFPGTT